MISKPDDPAYDPWLDRWSALFDEYRGPALDLGCGPGFDTQRLASWEFAVTATDISPEALAVSEQRNPRVKHVLADARTLEPFPGGAFNIVVACLSLHYFDRAGTLQAINAVSRVLRNEGLFVFRLNASDDHEFGAPLHFTAWELIHHHGKPKQFFSVPMIHEILDGRFELLSIEKLTTLRYIKKKSLFECIARKSSVKQRI